MVVLWISGVSLILGALYGGELGVIERNISLLCII